MGDVEEMIGELETSEDEPTDSQEPDKAKHPKGKDRKGKDETFGLDLDSAWSSPERSEER